MVDVDDGVVHDGEQVGKRPFASSTYLYVTHPKIPELLEVQVTRIERQTSRVPRSTPTRYTRRCSTCVALRVQPNSKDGRQQQQQPQNGNNNVEDPGHGKPSSC
jgi:hypothetical protein